MEIIYAAFGYCKGSKVHDLHEEQTVLKRVNRACKVGEVNLTVVITVWDLKINIQLRQCRAVNNKEVVGAKYMYINR